MMELGLVSAVDTLPTLRYGVLEIPGNSRVPQGTHQILGTFALRSGQRGHGPCLESP